MAIGFVASFDSVVESDCSSLAALLALLDSWPASDRVVLCPQLARGLDYYTGAIFEIAAQGSGGSLGGGGRYDDLVGSFAQRPIPAVGFSLGLERILLMMEERGMYPDLPGGPQLLLCSVGLPPRPVLEVAHRLRAQGLRVEIYPELARLGRQLQYATAIRVPFAAILGEAELAAGELTLKHLASGSQQQVAIGGVAERVGDWR